MSLYCLYVVKMRLEGWKPLPLGTFFLPTSQDNCLLGATLHMQVKGHLFSSSYLCVHMCDVSHIFSCDSFSRRLSYSLKFLPHTLTTLHKTLSCTMLQGGRERTSWQLQDSGAADARVWTIITCFEGEPVAMYILQNTMKTLHDSGLQIRWYYSYVFHEHYMAKLNFLKYYKILW